jgi:hypothetical protein
MKSKRTLILVLSVVIIVLIGVVGVLFWKYQKAKDPVDQAKATSTRIVQKVSNLYMVPQGEEPTVAQIQDKEKLGNKEFFKGAENGDYLLIYQKGKVAIVYREKTNKLVTVGPVSINDQKTDDQTQQGQTAGAETNTPAQ